MKQQDVLSILITFTVGAIGGAFLYISHFSKILNPDTLPTAQSASEFVIIGEAYGSCNDVCPSFQVLKDGSYRYRYTAALGEASTIKDGTVPLDIQRVVKKVLIEEELVAQSQPTTPPDCNSRNNAIDIRYIITLDGAEYTLDSCGTAIDDESETWAGLANLWNYFETIK